MAITINHQTNDISATSGDMTIDGSSLVTQGDTSTASMSFVIDEDNMASNSATKVPTQQSVKAYTDASVSGLVDSAPSTLDTLNELAAALGDDANFSTTVTNSIATKLPLAGGTMTGNIVMSSSGTVDGRDLSVDGAKLDGIEANATADQTAAEIRTLVESASDSNVFTDADHTKLNGIEASADVTDTANVTAAGALMDSEVTNLSQVKAFSSSDYATAAQGSTADAAMPLSGGTFTGDVTILNTDDDPYRAPDFNLKRDSASPAAWDYLGALRFLGEDGASNETPYASILGRIVDPTSGSEDGRLEIWQQKAGTGTLTYVFDHDVFQLQNEQPIKWKEHHGTAYDVFIEPATPSATRTITLPDATGTVALTSDINATNVTSAGALMDSEVTNLAQVKAFDSSDYATAAQGSTADAAMPKAGGTFTGTVTVGADGAGHNVKFFGGTSGEYVEWDASEDTLYFPDNSRLMFGGNGVGGDLRLYTNGTNAYIEAIQTTDLIIKNQQNDQDVTIQTDNGSGGVADYFRADGDTGEALLYHYGSEKLATKSTGIDVTGDITLGDANPTITFNDSSVTNLSHTISSASDNLKIMADANGVDAGSRVEIFDGTTEVARFSAGEVDITGTLTSDGLTVDGTSRFNNYIDFGGSISTPSTAAAIYRPADNQLAFSTANTERMRIDSSGNVGIGDAAPSEKLNVSGNIMLEGADQFLYLTNVGTGNNGIYVRGITADSTLRSHSTGIFTWEVTGSEKMRLIGSSGDLHVDGNVIAYSTTISDERLKEDIKPITGALDKVGRLSGYTFTYKADGKESAGVIAQEVEAVLPSAVTESTLPLKTDDDVEYKTVQYDQLHGLLIEAIKELKAEIEELKNGSAI